MRNDLISRKALLERIEKSMMENPHSDRKVKSNHNHEHAHFMHMVMDEPTAFDKEKVMEELRMLPELEVRQYPLHGRYIKKNIAIEIVERAGFNERD